MPSRETAILVACTLTLACAARAGQIETIALLVRRGADPHARRADGTTALTLAVSGGALTDVERPLLGACHAEIVRLLLRRAPDLRLGRVRPVDVSRLFAHLNGCDEVLRLTASQ